MREPLLIYGAGGLGREVLSLVRSLDQYEVIGFLDDNIPKGTLINRVKVVGGRDTLYSLDSPVNLVLAFGDPVRKSLLAAKINSSNVHYPVIRHPSVILQDESTITIGAGSIICAGCILTTDIQIGNHVLINLNCTVGHDSRIGDFSSVMPGVNVAGEVEIGKSVLVGSGVNIMNRIHIGDGSKVGMGAVVIHDVDPGITVVGVPARKV
jgi:sugar O-acyltransferase (sialic acid O-acetyltransferase NeuD family)